MGAGLGWIKGFYVDDNEGNGDEIAHVLYADDTPLQCEVDRVQALYLRVIFLVSKVVPGLKFNLSKGTVFCIYPADSIAQFAEILQCKVEVFLSTHLGIPLGVAIGRVGSNLDGL